MKLGKLQSREERWQDLCFNDHDVPSTIFGIALIHYDLIT